VSEYEKEKKENSASTLERKKSAGRRRGAKSECAKGDLLKERRRGARLSKEGHKKKEKGGA